MKLSQMYLDYWNNFLTIGGFASYYGLHVVKAAKMIAKGRILHNEPLGMLPSELAVSYYPIFSVKQL